MSQYKLLAFQPISSLQFNERPYIHGSHISDLMTKVMLILLLFPSWPLSDAVAVSRGAPWQLLQTSRKLSMNFYPSSPTDRKPLITATKKNT